ncbi:TPA: hypothetical protein ROX88_001808 [Bacillus pseudomycoides]|nr:hypothetical protein [Bacillus pseudomycoides]
MSSRHKNKFSFSSGILIIVIILTISSCNNFRNNIIKEKEHQKIVKGFNQDEFTRKLIPAKPLIQKLKQEFPNMTLKNSRNAGLTTFNPSKLEEYEINVDSKRLTIQIWTYDKSSYLKFSDKHEQQKFEEIDGMLQEINIVTNKDKFLVDSPFMKKIISVISSGINHKLTNEQLIKLTSKFVNDLKPFYDSKGRELWDKNRASFYKHENIEYVYSAAKPSPYAENLDRYIPIYGINIKILSPDEAEKAFKVIYDIKE